jgi:hypothetical protein
MFGTQTKGVAGGHALIAFAELSASFASGLKAVNLSFAPILLLHSSAACAVIAITGRL